MLSEEERLGLRIMALLSTGILKGYDCANCPEGFPEAKNCECIEQDSVVCWLPLFGDQLTACPIRYIPDSILGFLDEFNYLQKYFLRGGLSFLSSKAVDDYAPTYSFGAGAIFGPSQFDYTFSPSENYNSESIHRFSISFKL